MSTAKVSMETIGQQFIDAFNRRNAEDLVALADPAIEFHPTGLVGERRTYHGHDGLRRWVSDLGASGAKHQVRVLEVRRLDDSRFLVLSEVLLDGDLISPSAMIARLDEANKIVEARAYLTDEQMLTRVGLMDE